MTSIGAAARDLPDRFRNWPIGRKLLGISMAATGLALALAAVGILVWDSVLFQTYLQNDLIALSQIIADNSTGALAFDDGHVAAETLRSLRARKHVIAACIYNRDGSVLAQYLRPASETGCPPPGAEFEWILKRETVYLSRPIALSGTRLGTFTMAYDLQEIRDRRRIFGLTVIGILILSSVVAGVLSSRLRYLITTPISNLVKTTSAVAASSDYTLRASKTTGDEMGVLVDAFNGMLARIASRDDELRKALADRERANLQLARSNEDLERFAFVASHDLQEPLRMVTVYLQLLEKRSMISRSPEAEQFVDNIMSGASRMRELLADLRAYAEIGTDSESPAAVDLETVIVRARENLKMSIEDSGAVITHSPMPWLDCREAHLIPLFQNLIGNAIKYRGAAPPRIHLAYEQQPGVLRFAVSDNGIGIAREYHARVFAPFKRLHGRDVPGSGIGLAICRRVVERYGGRIWVESQPGAGSIFRFELPDRLLSGPPGKERET